MTRQQAEGVMTVLAEVVEESVKGMEASLVSKAEQEKVRGLLIDGVTASLFVDHQGNFSNLLGTAH